MPMKVCTPSLLGRGPGTGTCGRLASETAMPNSGSSAGGISVYSLHSLSMNLDGLEHIRVSYCLARDMATNISLRSSL